MDREISEGIRAFNRFYSGVIDLFDTYSIHPELTDLEGRILYEIDSHEGLTARDLIDILHIDRGYLSRIMTKLEKDGYIARYASRSDRRQKDLALTEKGREALSLCVDNANRNVGIQFDGLSDESMRQIVAAMRDIEQIYRTRKLV